MRPSPVIKLSLEGEVMSSIYRVDPRKYENNIVNELHRRAIEMARARDKTAAGADEELDSTSSPSPDSYKVILKYKDIDGEECK
jgi:hypothetical protein